MNSVQRTVFNANVLTTAAGSVVVPVGNAETLLVAWEVVDSGATADLGTTTVKPWSPAIAAVPTNEVQSLTISATGGTYTISWGGETTEAIAFDATAAEVAGAMNMLGGLAGCVSATGAAGGPYTITFGGDLAGTNVAQITTTATNLTGGAGTATPATVTAGSTAAAVDPYLLDNAMTPTVVAAVTRVGTSSVKQDRYDVRGLSKVTMTFTNAAGGTKNLRIHTFMS